MLGLTELLIAPVRFEGNSHFYQFLSTFPLIALFPPTNTNIKLKMRRVKEMVCELRELLVVSGEQAARPSISPFLPPHFFLCSPSLLS